MREAVSMTIPLAWMSADEDGNWIVRDKTHRDARGRVTPELSTVQDVSPHGSWEAGRVVAGRYRLQTLVGAGAMGVVWRAADMRLNRVVAVKQLRLPPALTADEAQRAQQRVFREARIAARLQHPHAVGIYDVTTDEQGQPVLILEYLPSRSLATALAEHGPLPPEQVARIGAAIASALAAAHAAGIVHRDVKPGNILLAGHDTTTAKITDFGISHAAGDVTVTSTGLLAGTPAFLSPEAARGEPPSPASDVFSLAATLYTAVDGTPPFGEADNPIAQLHRVAAGHAPPPRHAGPLTQALMSMLADDPTTRPTMPQVAAALADQPSTATQSGAAVPGTVTTPAPTRLDLQPFSDPQHAHGTPSTTAGNATPPGTRQRRTTYTLLGLLATGLLILLATTLLTAPDTGVSSSTPSTAITPSSGIHSTPSPSPVNLAVLQQAIAEYYTLLPDNTGQAWTLLGPAMQAQGREQYETFWRDVKDLRIHTAPQVSGNTVTVEIEYTRESRGRIRETHQHSMLLQNDTPLINSDQVLSSQITKGNGNKDGNRDKEKDKKKENQGGDN
jgi:eukaryotic-like serine/threonine-protein kinase